MAETRFVSIAFLVALLATLTSAPARASTFDLEFRQFDGSNLICSAAIDAEQHSSKPVTCAVAKEVSGATGFGTVAMQGSAGRGWVRSSQLTIVTSQNGFNLTYGGCSRAASTIDDILVTGPAGPATTELTVDISGITTGDSPIQNPPIRVDVTLTSRRSDGTTRDSATGFINVGIPEAVDTTFSPGPVDVEAGDTLIVKLQIAMDIGLFTDPGHVSKDASIDFADTPSMNGVSFSRTGPVFDLPAGYTVNSVDGRIEDNLWTPEIFFDGFECGDTNSWTTTLQ